jgi:hypothetical protein
MSMGSPFEYFDGARKPSSLDLEILIRDLDTDMTKELLSNDDLRAQLKGKDKAFQE